MSASIPTSLKPWFSRTFAFDLEPWMMPCVIERLRGTPARIAERLAATSRDVRTRHPDDGKWSVQENAGHLLDLEPLWIGRLRDTVARAETLTAADLTNKKTHEAQHDRQDLASILERFASERARYVAELEKLSRDQATLASFHPRLKVPMRIIDQAFFVAEHDDHHLARISEMLNYGR